MLLGGQFPPMGFEFLSTRGHPVLPECMLSPFFNFGDPLHSLQSRLHEITVVANRYISAFLEIDSGINNHLFPSCPSKGFGPPHFAWVSLHLEVLMTFRGAETKDLCIISHKGSAMTWIHAF